MCGIAGSLAWAGGSPVDVEGAVGAQRHRGPDAAGSWADETCRLGHRRLAIIDLSDRGCQPMGDSTGQVQIVFNGEIYNFLELRKLLGRQGHSFRGGSDTEVLLAAYREWGEAALSRLRGMFAFAIWDARARTLFLARDRVGKKPLYYSWLPDGFVFASEVSALLEAEGVRAEPDLAAIEQYLSWGYVPAPGTGLTGVFKLPPATSLTIDVSGGKPIVTSRQYWSLNYEPKISASEAEAARMLREEVSESIQLRMISDVPLGALLSGGVDSSVVVGVMAQLSSRPVKTFTIGFEDSQFDERAGARAVARRWSTDHHELLVQPDAVAILPTLARHYGEPFADSSALPTFYVAQLAREHVTVALTGDGGDESFAGYDRYAAQVLSERLPAVPGSAELTRAVARALGRGSQARGTHARISRFLASAAASPSQRYRDWVGLFTQQEQAALLGNPPSRQPWWDDLFTSAESLAPLDAAMSVDIRSYLPFDLLAKVDIATMVHSLEARAPLLDHHVMEFAARLPTRYKRRGHTSKWLLRRAFRDLLVDQPTRGRKRGFGVPVASWLRGPLRPMFNDTVLSTSSRCGAYLNASAIRRLDTDHQTGRADNSGKLWALLMLETWHREVVDLPRRVRN